MKFFVFKGFYIFIIKNIEMEEMYIKKIKESIYYDGVTKLPNLEYFLEHLEGLIAKSRLQSKEFALAIIDIANFQNIVNILGINEANKTLVQITQILKKHTSNDDFVAKIDESKFAIILNNTQKITSLSNMFRPIFKNAKNSIKIEEYEIEIFLKAGVSFFLPQFSFDRDTLIKFAKFALSEAYLENKELVVFTNELKKKLDNI